MTNTEIFANDSIENVRFEGYETITLLPCMICVKTENWLRANNIPFERIRKNNLPKNVKKTCVFESQEWNAYFGLKTNINVDDLTKMASTIANTDEYFEKYSTINM